MAFDATAPEAPIVRRSQWLFDWFCWYCTTYYLPGAFDAVRLSGSPPDTNLPGPHVFVMNHPSWWDPLIGLIASRFFPAMKGFAPIDKKALDKYAFFGRLGLFGVDQNTIQGAKSFMASSKAILKDPNHSLWITVQGEFTDPRIRPVSVRPGAGHLLANLEQGTLWPLVMEFPFWEEAFPEALIRFGAPVPLCRTSPGADKDWGGENPGTQTHSGTHPGDPKPFSPKAWNARIARILERTMDDLARDAMTRDPARFVTIIKGKSRVGGMFDRLRRMASFFTGNQFDPRHLVGTKDSNLDKDK
jgi:1-acyl-sn-glycerol-3-phosphate acyltransferase